MTLQFAGIYGTIIGAKNRVAIPDDVIQWRPWSALVHW